ncbi:MAG: BamA/TamA family outer membrane protein [Parvibaculum sp.]|uniref:autotransporter assembly complex protein TamA n=1 Tax=Parvibaculum sp. TaxID=2024848 RepID=UPI002715A252|nr:BamA/TamA family outer membrane protein [Parvibaculum sp.]MDO8839057.1 BamA/TamA family outer membrane protein [Parvibaculum sp.]
MFALAFFALFAFAAPDFVRAEEAAEAAAEAEASAEAADDAASEAAAEAAEAETAAARAAADEAATPRVWERAQGALSFTTRVAGRRIPDQLREMLEEARALGVDDADGVPPPSTLAQLRRRAQEDSLRLVEVLRSEAYYNGRVTPMVREASGGRFEVIYQVVLAERAMIRSFRIVYPDLADSEVAAHALPQDGAALGLQPERAARAERIVDLTNEAVTHLHNHGYPQAALDNRRVVVDLSSSMADVTLTIAAGPRLLFGPLLVRNEGGRTREDYVTGLATLTPGKVYDRREVDATTAALRGSGLFETVSVTTGAVDAEGHAVQEIELAERKPRTVRLGAAWSSSEGAGVRGSWEHRNLFGAAEKLVLGLSIAEIEQKGTAEFRKPRFLRPDQALLISAEIANAQSDAYDEYRLRTGASLERVFGPRLSGSAGVGFEVTQTEDATGRTDYQLFSVPAVLRYDSADDIFDPSEGIRATVAATPYFGSADGAATTFLRLEGSGATYFAVADRLTLAVRGRYGMLAADDTTDVPGSTRFYAGGGGSVRGYGYQMAGPLSATGTPLGGRSVIEAGAEARYRVSETIGVVAFVDAGQAYRELTPRFDGSLLWGAGLGLRYYTPIGPIRFDVAVPLDRRRGVDDAFQIYASIGQAF